MKVRYLTKSRFKIACECPRKLYYTGKQEYADAKLDDSFLQALAEGGFQVCELAKLYYPGGVDITDSGYDIPLERTYKLLEQENVIIYEAAIRYNNLFIRIDVLVKQGNKVKLIEVKAKSYNPADENFFTNTKGYIKPSWKPYMYDVAFQKYVLTRAFPEFNVSSYLMLADKSKHTTVEGLNQKFQLFKDQNGRSGVEIIGDVSAKALGNPILTAVNVDEYVQKIYEGKDTKEQATLAFEESINVYADAYKKDEKLNIPISANCGSCEFKVFEKGKKSGFAECWKEQTKLSDTDLKKPLIFDLWNYRLKQKRIDEHVYVLEDLNEAHFGNLEPNKDGTLSTKERQWLQVEKVKNKDNSVYLDLSGLKAELANHNYPLHFIDFETSMVAIPFYKNSKPYEQIAFQFSHHILEKDGTVKHQSQYLNTKKGKIPNFEFLRELKKALENDRGTIFRYSNHENTVLNQIKRQIQASAANVPDADDLIAFIELVSNNKEENNIGARNMIDMLEIVKNYHYDPYTGGSNSIKYVLPAVLNSSAFIQNRYSKAIYGKGLEINSLNFTEPQVWIKKGEDGKVVSPYKLLPPLFDNLSGDEIEGFLTEENLADGGAALTAYAKMQFTAMSNEERASVEQGLLRYCELDTLAMVMIYEYWLNELAL